MQFGQYQTIGELSSGPFGTVFRAKRAAVRREFAVKQFNPDLGVVSPNQARQALIDFVERAEIQKRVATGGGKHWATVHELKGGDGAYCVLAYFPFSATRLIESRAELSAEELYSVVTGIIAGLDELRQSCGRAHGNLKRENVLLGARGESAGIQVALTDPCATWLLGGPGEAERRDLRAIGELIHDLVVPNPRSAHHAGPSPQWERLGPTGEGWRSLCNDLIAEDADRMLANLEELKKRAAKLKPRSSGGARGKWLAAAAVIVLLGGAALFVMNRRGQIRISDWTMWARNRVAPRNDAAEHSTDTGHKPRLPETAAVPATRESSTPVEEPATHPIATTQPVVVVAQPATTQATQVIASTHPATQQVVDATNGTSHEGQAPATMSDLAPARQALADSIKKVQVLLDQGYGMLPDPGADASPLRAAVDRYREDRAQLPGAEADALTRDLEARLSEQVNLARLTDGPMLLQTASATEHPEVALGAWRRLEQAQWPADDNVLPQAWEAYSRLGTLLDRIDAPERKNALKQEIAASLTRFWQSRAESPATTAAIDSALELAPKFGAPAQLIANLASRRQSVRRAEFRDVIERLHTSKDLNEARYAGAKALADANRPLMEPNRCRLIVLADAQKNSASAATFRQLSEANFPDLVIYRWLIATRAMAAGMPEGRAQSQIFGQVAVTFARAGYLSDAVDTAAGMADSARKVSVFCTVAQFESDAGQKNVAKTLLDQASTMVEHFRSTSERLDAYLELARTQAKIRLADDAKLSAGQARGICRRITDPKENVAALLKVCQAQAELGDTPGAVNTASRFPAGSPERVTAYRMIACGQADAGNLTGARSALISVDIPADRALAQAHIAAGLARAGDATAAESAAESIQSRKERTLAYLLIAEARIATGDKSGARAALDSALGDPSTLSDPSLRLRMVSAQSAAGNLVGARANAAGIEAAGARADVYIAIAEIQRKSNDNQGARTTLQAGSKGLAGTSEGDPSSALLKIATEQARLGDLDSARQTMELAKTRAASGGSGETDDLNLERAQAACGQWDEIDRLAKSAKDPAHGAEILTEAAGVLLPARSEGN